VIMLPVVNFNFQWEGRHDMEMIIGNTITLVTLVSKRILPTQAQLAKCYVDAECQIAKKGAGKWWSLARSAFKRVVQCRLM
jgi:hypothetical protein